MGTTVEAKADRPFPLLPLQATYRLETTWTQNQIGMIQLHESGTTKTKSMSK